MGEASGWLGLTDLLVLSDPAVYPRPVRHLGRGKEEGTTASPGVRRQHISRMF
jgi:hypothetical protein